MKPPINPDPLADFDFDRMVDLAKTDPSGFARERRRLVDDAIEHALDSTGLGLFQMAIDADRFATAPGMPASRRALEMSLDTLRDLADAILMLERYTGRLTEQSCNLTQCHHSGN